ncbi:hypothetical protein BSPWISOXPB_494 [uncultured Gammaproteobacteria bacterium]|nr:hypothetical protein BSPWISOXPB_494 [uncultured Gammaproteobacteria bacterium]
MWSNNQKSRLIESILLKLPLPVFYFDVSDPEKWMVIDGLQRISTSKVFLLTDIKLKGLEFLTNYMVKNVMICPPTYKELLKTQCLSHII